MAQLNSNIILAGAQPDVVGAFDRGQQAGARGNAIQQQNRLAQVFQTQGPGIAAGDPGALNALAAIDPMASICTCQRHTDRLRCLVADRPTGISCGADPASQRPPHPIRRQSEPGWHLVQVV